MTTTFKADWNLLLVKIKIFPIICYNSKLYFYYSSGLSHRSKVSQISLKCRPPNLSANWLLLEIQPWKLSGSSVESLCHQVSHTQYVFQSNQSTYVQCRWSLHKFDFGIIFKSSDKDFIKLVFNQSFQVSIFDIQPMQSNMIAQIYKKIWWYYKSLHSDKTSDVILLLQIFWWFLILMIWRKCPM